MGQLHSRAEAGLRPPRRPATVINADILTAHYGGPSPWSGANRSSSLAFFSSTPHSRCPIIWAGWQAFHMDDPLRKWHDIAYNSGICPHGHRYEGRGPKRRSAGNGTNTGNALSHATCYIAGDADPLTDQAKVAFHEEAVRFGSRLLYEHSHWKQTQCAGSAIKQWASAGFPLPHPINPEVAMAAMQADHAVVPTWERQQPNFRIGFFLLTNIEKSGDRYNCLVMGFNGARTQENLDVYGTSAQRLLGLHGRPVGIQELHNGHIVVLTADGGVFGVATAEDQTDE